MMQTYIGLLALWVMLFKSVANAVLPKTLTSIQVIQVGLSNR